MFLSTALTGGFVLLSLGASIAQANLANYAIHESRSHIPSGWSLTRRYEPSQVIPLRFGLQQSNLDKLEDMLLDVSHPESPNYGKHWSPEQVLKTFAPSNETISIVHTWLLNSGFHPKRLRLSPGWIAINATVEEAERLLLTQYHVYSHENGEEHVACTRYHLPERVRPHVEIVTPTIHFDAILKKRDGSPDTPASRIGQPGVGITPKITDVIADPQLAECDKLITPACLRGLYGLFYQPIAGKKNTFAIVEYTPQAYLQSDLDTFNQQFSPNLVGKSPKLESIDGGVVQTTQKGFGYNGESNLDLEYAMNLVNPVGDEQEVLLYQVGDLERGASFNNLLDALDGKYCKFMGGDDPKQDAIYPNPDCGTVKPANVISTSYGYNEADLSDFYLRRQCEEYGKLGLMGVTVLFSSGDNGVAGNGNLCLNPDGSQSAGGKLFNPSFPSTCPYVTSIGATQVNPGSTIAQPESACQQVIRSGGGFSNHFAVPDYQKKNVGDYLQQYKPSESLPAGVFNSTGKSRAFPDISANGANYAVAIEGKFYKVYGTSASAPVVGAILTMINDARLAVDKGPIGFINPTIYSDDFKEAFNDITSGGNAGCNTAGFTAVAGWDPVTGLGTPSFPKLLAKWLALP